MCVVCVMCVVVLCCGCISGVLECVLECVIYVFYVCGVCVFVRCVWCAIRSNWWYLLLECVFVCVCVVFLCFYNYNTLVTLLQYTVLTLLFLSR